MSNEIRSLFVPQLSIARSRMTTFLQHMLTRKNVRSGLRWLVVVVVMIALLAGGRWAWSEFTRPQLMLTEVVTGPVVQAFYATGTLVPYREYPVKSNVDGTVTEVLVDKGEQVKKGQKLVQVYVEEYVLRRDQLTADLELKLAQADEKTSPVLLEFDVRIQSTGAQLEMARRELGRLNQIRNTGGRSLTELDRAEESVKTLSHAIEALNSAKSTKRLEMQRDVKVARAALDLAEWNLQQQTIVSPVDGVVLDWPITLGSRVKQNDMLMHVGNVAHEALVLRTNVDEEDITRVRPLQVVKVSLYAYPGRLFEGRVQKVYPQADPARRTFEVDVAIRDPDRNFSAGMTSELAFVVDEKAAAIVVPSQAIQKGKAWTVRDNRLESIEVETGLRSILRTEIKQGLQPGDRIVISAVGNLTPGAVVRTTWIDPHEAASLNEPKKDETKFSKF